MNRLTLTAVAALAVMGAAACSDREDDVVQPPAAGAAPEPVTETQAQVAQTQAAVAFGMTRQELEDAVEAPKPARKPAAKKAAAAGTTSRAKRNG